MSVPPSTLPTAPLLDEIAFLHLNTAELEEAAKFGERCTFSKGECLFSAGDSPFDCFVIISGDICIVDISRGSKHCVVRYGSGYFTGDIDLFTGRRAVHSCEAEASVEAIRITPNSLREMFVRKPGLDERFWKASEST